MNNQQKLYAAAKGVLDAGESLVPAGFDPDLGCAISMCELLKRIGVIIPETPSTATLIYEFEKSLSFIEIGALEATAGDIIICATGTSSIYDTPIQHGHVGVIGKFGIMSNDSDTGLWKEKYTIDTWRQRWEVEGGYQSRYFRVV